MRTSYNNTHQIEEFLLGQMLVADRLLFEARMLLSPALRRDVYFQKKAYLLVKMYHRQKVKEELETLHRQLFSNPAERTFQESVMQWFKK